MSKKNSIVLNHKNCFSSSKQILKIHLNFKKKILKFKANKFLVAVSGGPDSLALSFLAKIYSINYGLNIKYFTVDHKLRKNSTSETKHLEKLLKKFSINLNILTWKGIKPKKNIQSVARG